MAIENKNLDKFLKDLKENPSMLHWKVDKIASNYHLTQQEMQRLPQIIKSCEGLSGKALENRISTIRTPLGLKTSS